MEFQHLPKWTHALPTVIGVTLSVIGMSVLPEFGLRNTLGPIIGLPLGMVIGVGALEIYARTRSY